MNGSDGGFAAAIAALDARQPESMPGPSLDRIRALLDLLDDPQRTYPTIHVAGTNGKSTAARGAAGVACAFGVTAGLYLSPHLVRITERISVCGVDMTTEEFGEEWGHLDPYLQVVDQGPAGAVTYFEAVTALAMLWFADKPVGLGVIEVGMGGRWDATNLVTGDVGVITPIGMDHVAELGPTIADIAGEKAGILKEGRPAVVRRQDHPEAADVLAATASAVGAELLVEDRDWEIEEELLALGGQSFRLRGRYGTYEDLYVPMYGSHAVHNAAAGVVAFEVFAGQALDEATLREGLAGVRSPGRLEVVATDPLIVLDGAHNPDGAEALAEAFVRPFTYDRVVVVLAVSANKDVAGVVAPIAAIADVVIATRNDSVRSAEPQVVAEAAGEAGAAEVRLAGSVAEAIDLARTAVGPAGAVLVTGSLFTVGDAKRALA
jgi:dihydrofolate synthase/folylpolyglutamate synthase